MPDRKLKAPSSKAKSLVKAKRVAKAKLVEKPVPKIGLPTRLAAIQTRYRNALTLASDLPYAEQGDRIREALATLLAEKAALGVKDGEEAAAAPE